MEHNHSSCAAFAYIPISRDSEYLGQQEIPLDIIFLFSLEAVCKMTNQWALVAATGLEPVTSWL